MKQAIVYIARMCRVILLPAVALALSVSFTNARSQVVDQSVQTPECIAGGATFHDYFTDGNDVGWTQINRAWHIYRGRYVLDGDYLPDAVERDGHSVTHVGDRSWRNYLMQATFDNTNPAHLPSPDVHNAMFFVRVQSAPLGGTFYRIDVWPKGTTDPRGGPHNGKIIPGGLVQIFKYVKGDVVKVVDREYSNSIAGTNTIAIKVVNGTLWVWINGVQILKFTDAHPIPYGGIGLGAIWEAQAWFDNVLVDPAK